MSETKSIYFELLDYFNKMPVGLPETRSGVEIRLLKQLFTEEEAQLAMKLNFNPQKLTKIYRKLKKNGLSLEEVDQKLEKMYEKGTIIRALDNGDKLFLLAPFVPGIYEFQLGRLTPELINNVFQYFDEAYFEKEYNVPGIPQLRTIPVEEAVPVDLNISSYDKIREIVEMSSEIGIMDCICRKAHDMTGDPCKRTDLRKTCMTFGTAARLFHEKGEAEFISKEKAYDLIKDFKEAGLVPQPSNSQKPFVICNCCGCCCEVLTNQKRFDNPARLFASNFHAVVDSELCSACGVCEERCNMDAVSIIDGSSEIDLERCIGCGLCVPTCPENAIKLEKNEKETIPPSNTKTTYIEIMNAKAKIAQNGKGR
ncbi:MAG: 4Fe-4S binding protein [Candidatus Lokiarchaeota archaeon]|nr:4Fe-4S binding protein [Candidatus Lokiarchaeota archaeon]